MRRYVTVGVRNRIWYSPSQALEKGSALGYPPLKKSSSLLNNGRHVRRYLTRDQENRAISKPYQDSIIYALSTAAGRAGIAIVRISGPTCLEIYRALCPSKPIPKPRYATLRTLYHPAEDVPANVLDSDALVLYFPAPHTVTGEEMLELHIHGGPATVKAVLAAIPDCARKSRIRYAEPGEFTRRAFQNNRLDLAQVEALSDTLAAETEQQRRAAVRGNSGALGKTYETWRQQLLEARGELEAIIDFSEDQYFDDSNEDLLSNIGYMVASIIKFIESHEEGGRRGELLRKGFRISMLGHANAGKSSLLNLIVGREASIVSKEAGTTRDVVEVGLDIEGYLCTFADTAGLRAAALGNGSNQGDIVGEVELEGIRRAKAKAIESDLILVVASVEPIRGDFGWEIRCDLEALEIASKVPKSLLVVNKVDLVSSEVFKQLLDRFKVFLSQRSLHGQVPRVVTLSCRAAQENESSMLDAGDLHQLVRHLVADFRDMTIFEDEHLLGVTERQRQLLKECKGNCQKYLEEARMSAEEKSKGGEVDIVLAAEHLRSAGNCLSRITGRGEASDVEEVLGVVFEKFCVGK